jgi:hypothetical protein
VSRQVTIQVSDEVARHASQVAAQTSQRIEDVLAGWLQSAISELPVENLPDDEVLALSELRLPPDQQAAMSDLLERNRENMLDNDERHRLRKAQALRVAVQRGLREPLQA